MCEWDSMDEWLEIPRYIRLRCLLPNRQLEEFLLQTAALQGGIPFDQMRISLYAEMYLLRCRPQNREKCGPFKRHETTSSHRPTIYRILIPPSVLEPRQKLFIIPLEPLTRSSAPQFGA